MNALLGCPFLLPPIALNDLPPSLLVVIINTCIESVNIFAESIVLSSSSSTRGRLLDHALASTLICRLIQIASLRFCLCALLLRRIKDAAFGGGATDTPRQVYEVIDTVTFDPNFVPPTTSGHHTCVKRLLLYTPSSAGKS